MPTAKPRIAITLEPEQHAVLARLAALQRRPMSRVVAELVAEFTPILARVVGTMEAAVHAQESVKANIRRAVDEAEATILPHAEAVLAQYERFEGDLRQLALQIEDTRGPRPSRARRGWAGGLSGPRPVITGATKPQRKGKQASAGSRKGGKA